MLLYHFLCNINGWNEKNCLRRRYFCAIFHNKSNFLKIELMKSVVFFSNGNTYIGIHCLDPLRFFNPLGHFKSSSKSFSQVVQLKTPSLIALSTFLKTFFSHFSIFNIKNTFSGKKLWKFTIMKSAFEKTGSKQSKNNLESLLDVVYIKGFYKSC